MTRLTAISLVLLAVGVAQGHAESTSEICQTVNGRTSCVQATGNISCTSVNGETRCTRLEPDENLPPLPDITMPGMDIRQDGDRLRVRAGGTHVIIEGTRP